MCSALKRSLPKASKNRLNPPTSPYPSSVVTPATPSFLFSHRPTPPSRRSTKRPLRLSPTESNSAVMKSSKPRMVLDQPPSPWLLLATASPRHCSTPRLAENQVSAKWLVRNIVIFRVLRSLIHHWLASRCPHQQRHPRRQRHSEGTRNRLGLLQRAR